MVPGFQDSHLHFPGASVNEVDLVGVESLKEFQRRMAGFAKYILHCHGSRAMVGVIQRFPINGRQEIHRRGDSDRPVYVTERDMHMGWQIPRHSKSLAFPALHPTRRTATS